jgi:hypothetical protein
MSAGLQEPKIFAKRGQPPMVLRVLLVGLILGYAAALYFEWHLPALSAEAVRYRNLVIETNGGFSIGFGIQKLLWLAGTVLGLIGALFLFVGKPSGKYPLFIAGPIVMLALVIAAVPSAYPNIEPTRSLLLWCVVSAFWGGAVAFSVAWTRSLLVGDRNVVDR